MNNASTKLFGKYRAQVLNINDPEMRGRILVRSPKVLNNHELGWAESCFPPGQFFLPRKNDYVWIEFEEGDVHKPIWVGIMPTRQYVRDYIMGSGTYYNSTSFIRHYEGDIHVATSKSFAMATGDKATVTATNEIKLDATKLTNTRSWSVDNT
jgi:hypothetical protein